jgi:hypothetical protein
VLTAIGFLAGLLFTVGMMVANQDSTTVVADKKGKAQWTADQAASWVQHNIWLRNNTCERTICFHTDPVLYEFNWDPETFDPIPSRFKKGLADLVSRTSVRDMWFYDNCRCWLVELLLHEEDLHGYLFWTWEANSWVESNEYNSDFSQN